MNDHISKSQMFFDGLLPGNIYRTRNRAFAKIVGTGNNDEQSKEIDRDQLLDVTRKIIREWDEQPGAVVDSDLAISVSPSEDNAVIISPDSIYVDPYPLMLKCSVCHALDHYNSRASIKERIAKLSKKIRTSGNRSRIPCARNGCHGNMLQMKHVSIHRCGKMEEIQLRQPIPKPYEVGFISKGGSFKQGRFVNMNTGENTNSSHQRPCAHCNSIHPGSEGVIQGITTVDNPEKFFPLNIQYLCLDKSTGTKVSQVTQIIGTPSEPLSPIGRDLAEALGACLIGQCTGEGLNQHIQDVLNGDSQDESKIVEIQAELDQARSLRDAVFKQMLGVSEETARDACKVFDAQIDGLESKLTVASGKYSGVLDYLSEGTIQLLSANRRSFEATLMPYDFARERQTLPEMIGRIADPVLKDRLLQDSAVLKSRYGVNEISHYKEVNVVMASIGYTREKMGASESTGGDVVPTILMGYKDECNESLMGKTVIYGLPAKTEGIHIRLDPCRILRWCVESAGWENPGEKYFLDEVLARTYLLENCPALKMDPSEVMFDTRHDPLLNSAPFHLLHTISHCLLGVIKRHTGYDEKSVMEYLLPMDFSFILYVASVKNYTAGGLLTLFKHHLRQWFDDASNYAFNCIFDPVCSDKGSTCSGCVQIVLGCETFNHGLSRSYLHGGMVDDSQHVCVTTGFWQ
jgi:hypothetical protein